MKVLVTGASSLIGSGVTKQLLAAGHNVIALQRNPADLPGEVQQVLGSVADPVVVRRAVHGCNAVVHLAARVGITGTAEQFQEANVRGTEVLLAEARDAKVGRFIHISSPSVAHAGEPLVGAPSGPADPSAARGLYSITKARAELLAVAANRPGLAVVVLRPHLVWGPGDTQLVGRVVERARQGRLAIVGSGAALIDSTYVSNAVDAIVAAIGRADAAAGEVLVISNGQPRPIAELLEGILAAHGLPLPRRHIPATVAKGIGWLAEQAWERFDLDGEPPMTVFTAEQLAMAHWFDQRRTREVLAWEPRITIDQGLALLGAAATGE